MDQSNKSPRWRARPPQPKYSALSEAQWKRDWSTEDDGRPVVKYEMTYWGAIRWGIVYPEASVLDDFTGTDWHLVVVVLDPSRERTNSAVVEKHLAIGRSPFLLPAAGGVLGGAGGYFWIERLFDPSQLVTSLAVAAVTGAGVAWGLWTDRGTRKSAAHLRTLAPRSDTQAFDEGAELLVASATSVERLEVSKDTRRVLREAFRTALWQRAGMESCEAGDDDWARLISEALLLLDELETLAGPTVAATDIVTTFIATGPDPGHRQHPDSVAPRHRCRTGASGGGGIEAATTRRRAPRGRARCRSLAST